VVSGCGVVAPMAGSRRSSAAAKRIDLLIQHPIKLRL
jgi:hypothetical protein